MQERLVFQTTGYRDRPDDIAENVNEIAGKALINAVVAALVKRGFHNPEVYAEDWGWCFEIDKDQTTYLGGGLLYQDAKDPAGAALEASVFIDHRPHRSLRDVILGRNKARHDLSARAMVQLKSVLQGLPDVSDIQVE